MADARMGVAKPLAEYEQDVRTGGNHLANVLLRRGIEPREWRSSTYDEVLQRFGPETADIWTAWRSIIQWSGALQRGF